MPIYAEYARGADFERADTGEYLCVIKNIEHAEKPGYTNKDVMEPKFCWIFETTKEMDSKGNPFQFRQYTGVRYGNDKATLTTLVNGIFERHFQEFEWPRVDLEKLIGQQVKCMVSLEKGKEDGKPYNAVTKVYRPRGKAFDNNAYIDPIQPEKKSSMPVKSDSLEDDTKDPFEDS